MQLPTDGRSWRRARILAHGLVAFIQAIALWVFAAGMRAFDGFPLDDAWIHQVVARTFAQTGTLGYVPGQHGAGATSYLWATILAANYRFFHRDPVYFTHTLNVLVAFAIGQCLVAMLLRTKRAAGEPIPWTVARAVVSAALACVGGNFMWFAFSGMETAFSTLLVVLGILAFTSQWKPRVRMGTVTLCVFMLALTRPDLMVAGAVALAACVFPSRRLTDAAWIAGGWLAGVGIYVGSNLLLTATAFPSTLGGRRWLWLEDTTGLSHLGQVRDFLLDWCGRLRDGSLGTSATIALWLSLPFAAYGIRELVRARNVGMIALVAWIGIHVSVYAVLLPTAGHAGRYQPLMPLAYLATLALGTMACVEDVAALVRRGPAVRRIAAEPVIGVAALVPWMALMGVGFRDWRGDNVAAIAHIARTEIGAARFIRTLPHDERVASFDIGASGFFSDRPIFDIGGLSGPVGISYIRRGRLWEYLKENGITYVVLPVGYEVDLPEPFNLGHRLRLYDNPAVSLEPVRLLQSPREIFDDSFRSTQNASPGQIIFEISFTGEPALASRDVLAAAPAIVDAVDGLRSRERMLVEYDLRKLAGNGVQVRLAITSAANAAIAAAPDDAWDVRFGSWGVEVVPPKGETKIPRAEAQALVEEWLTPYLDARDFENGATAALYGIVLSIRRWADPTFDTLLRTLPLPAAPDRNSPRVTAPWGIPLTVGVFALLVLLSRRARAANAANALGGQQARV